jgi:solute:Na+ symporter, SSS family
MPSKTLLTADYLVVGLYLIAVLAAGFWFSRMTKSGRDFFVGGNRIPWWAAGISLYMTTFSAWMFTGVASFVYNTGWFGILFLVVKDIGFLIGFLLSAVRWRRSRITSPVEYVEQRYNHTTRILLSIVLVVSMMYWPGHHLASVARICAPALIPNTPWAVDALIVFFGVFVVLYTVAGGIWAVSITDVLQFLVLVSVCVVLVFAIAISGEIGSLSEFIAATPPLALEHTIREGTVYTHWYMIGFVVAGIFGNVVGDKAQRFFTVPAERDARKAGWLTFGLFLLSPLLFGLPPLVGKMLWPDASQLISFAGTPKADESIFIAVVLHYLPPGVVGLFLAAMMAASMSALDSVWNTVSAIVSVDLYQGHLRPNASDRELLVVGRVTVVFLFIAAVAMAYVLVHSPLGLFTFSNIVLGLIAIPVTVPLLTGVISRVPLTWSAIPSILCGTLIAAEVRFDLNWTLGPQYIAVVAVCLVPLFTSRWLGQVYVRKKMMGYVAVIGIGVLLWFAFAFIAAPTMVPGVSRSGGDSIWLPGTLAGISLLTALFLPLYGREIEHPPERVVRFFARLDTPVDVEAEVGRNIHVGQPGAIIGWAAAGLALVPFILLVTSGGSNWPILVALDVVLLGIAVPFFVAGRTRSNGAV